MGFAVVDFETTGILPSYHHRVVEVGVTHVELDGTVSGHWETLINPERDLGPQHIHGVTAAQVLQAPLFSDVAADLSALLQGRVFVAHNAAFDLRFLVAEFQRAGYWLSEAVPHLCTMRLGAQFGLGGSAALATACDHFGIDNTFAHSAGADSSATAELLSAYLSVTAEMPAWRDYWFDSLLAAREFPFPDAHSTGVIWLPRSEAVIEPAHFLQRISAEAKHPRATGAEAEYLSLLDQCLLDRVISVSEAQQLASVAIELGFSRSEAHDLNSEYFRALARVAWADGVLTGEEQRDLDTVAGLLGISSVEQTSLADEARVAETVVTAIGRDSIENSAVVGAFSLKPGDLIVLTGEMTRPRSDWEEDLRSLGFLPHSGITKKVRLLVAADPDTLSGKGKKARDYGIPIVTENGLRRLLSG